MGFLGLELERVEKEGEIKQKIFFLGFRRGGAVATSSHRRNPHRDLETTAAHLELAGNYMAKKRENKERLERREK